MLCVFDRRGRSGKYLGVNSNDCVALLAVVSEHSFVALDAVGVLVSEHIALTSKSFIAIPTAEVARVPVLRHGFGVFAAEN